MGAARAGGRRGCGLAWCVAVAACVYPLVSRLQDGIDSFLLARRVGNHIALVHSELQSLFDQVCAPSSEVRLPLPSEHRPGNINVPSCEAFLRTGLSDYCVSLCCYPAWKHDLT